MAKFMAKEKWVRRAKRTLLSSKQALRMHPLSIPSPHKFRATNSAPEKNPRSPSPHHVIAEATAVQVLQRPQHVVLTAKLNDAASAAVHIGKDNLASFPRKVFQILPAGRRRQIVHNDAIVGVGASEAAIATAALGKLHAGLKK